MRKFKFESGQLIVYSPFSSVAIPLPVLLIVLLVFVIFGGLIFWAINILWVAVLCSVLGLIVFVAASIRLLPKAGGDEPPYTGVGVKGGRPGPTNSDRQKTGRNSK